MASKWLTSCNHVNIGTMYIIMGVWSVGIGSGLSLLMRKEISCKGSFLGSDQLYYSLITAHAFIMVLFVVMPVLGAGFGNWLIPLMTLNKDMIFPRMNALSFWTVLPALLMMVSSMNTEGGSGTGWTVYPPLSGEGHSGLNVDIAILSLHMAGASSLMGAMNLMTTMHNRTSGLQMLTLSVFCWCIGVMAILLLVSLPVFAGAVTLLLLDRNASSSFYVFGGGGDPILFQHLFWFFGHPEVYILILPGLGAITHCVIWGMGSRAIYGRASLIVAVIAIGVMGCLVWAHHMFTVGLDLDTRAYFMAATVGIALPTGIKLYSWSASMFGNGIRWNIIMLWVYGLMCMLTFGGTTGVILANTVVDIVLHDTFLVVGHFHYVLSMGAVMSMGAGLYLWGPSMSGVAPSKLWSLGSFLVFLGGVNSLFIPTHFVGLSGGPRRYDHFPDQFHFWLKISTLGSAFAFNGFCGMLFGFMAGWFVSRSSFSQGAGSFPDLCSGGSSSLLGVSSEIVNFY